MVQAGIDPCHLNLKQFVLTSIPPGLRLKTASFLSYLILVFHIVTNFQQSSNSKQFVGTGGIDTSYLDLINLGVTTTPPRLMRKEVTCLLSLILVFYIVPNFQPSSKSKQVVGTGGNRCLSPKLETLWLDFYTTRVIAEVGFFSIILNTRFPHFSQLSTLIKLKTSRWHGRESIPVTQTWNTLAWPLHHQGYCWSRFLFYQT